MIFVEIEVNEVEYLVQADAAIEGWEMEPGLKAFSSQFGASLQVMCKMTLPKRRYTGGKTVEKTNPMCVGRFSSMNPEHDQPSQSEASTPEVIDV
jgi:hypothetical protein